MNISYRKLTENDLDRFISMRITQLREEGATEDIDLVPALKDYYHRHLADGTFVSWLALDGEKIVGHIFGSNTSDVLSRLSKETGIEKEKVNELIL